LRFAIRVSPPTYFEALMLYRRSACVLALLGLLTSMSAAIASETGFPFGSELMLEGETTHAQKRLPMIEIEEDGAATLDLWCGSVRAQAAVGGDGTIAITPGERDNGRCDPDRIAGDDDLLDMLVHLTKWRRRGDLVEFSGAPGTIRFHLMTN
jgi:hypothetical protein